MRYQEACDYVESFSMFKMKFGIEKMLRLLALFDFPQKDTQYIHVGGTNGKGSVAAILSSILRSAGFTVGTYTSPHLVRITERFRVNWEEMSEGDFIKVVERIRTVIDGLEENEKPTYFELTTLIAFIYFKEKNVDYAVMEVGLGGRLDATNVILPRVSIITNVSIEHEKILGSDLEKIAWEKGGIIKNKGTVVLGTTAQPVLGVIEQICGEKNAKLNVLGRDFVYKKASSNVNGQAFTVRTHNSVHSNLRTSLLGEFQIQNAAISIAALEELSIDITEEAVRKGLLRTKWPGRLEVVGTEPLFLVDCAHNIDASKQLASELKKIAAGKIILIVSISRDKDMEKMLAYLAPVASLVIATKHRYDRAAEPHVISGIAGRHTDSIDKTNLEEAIAHARKIASKNDTICLCGSIFLIGDFLARCGH